MNAFGTIVGKIWGILLIRSAILVLLWLFGKELMYSLVTQGDAQRLVVMIVFAFVLLMLYNPGKWSETNQYGWTSAIIVFGSFWTVIGEMNAISSTSAIYAVTLYVVMTGLYALQRVDKVYMIVAIIIAAIITSVLPDLCNLVAQFSLGADLALPDW